VANADRLSVGGSEMDPSKVKLVLSGNARPPERGHWTAVAVFVRLAMRDRCRQRPPLPCPNQLPRDTLSLSKLGDDRFAMLRRAVRPRLRRQPRTVGQVRHRALVLRSVA